MDRQMAKTYINRIIILCIVISVLIVLGGFWYWAIFGLSEEIAMALGVTAGVFGCGAIVGLGYVDYLDQLDRNKAFREKD